MTTEPFTPHADSIQTAWVLICQQSRISTQPHVEELEAEFDRFIAKVKRDAAREALAGLADNLRAARDRPGTPFVRPLGFSLGYVENYRETHHPEDVNP